MVDIGGVHRPLGLLACAVEVHLMELLLALFFLHLLG